MHPPTRAALLLAGLLAACTDASEPEPEPLRIHFDERPVLLGRVRQAIASPTTGDLYVELERIDGERRWLVLDLEAGSRARPGAWIRVRSLARRSHVWAPALERDFASLDYAALLE